MEFPLRPVAVQSHSCLIGFLLFVPQVPFPLLCLVQCEVSPRARSFSVSLFCPTKSAPDVVDFRRSYIFFFLRTYISLPLFFWGMGQGTSPSLAEVATPCARNALGLSEKRFRFTVCCTLPGVNDSHHFCTLSQEIAGAPSCGSHCCSSPIHITFVKQQLG